MKVHVKLFATLRDGRFKEETVEIAENGLVLDVLKKCNIPPEEVSICIVNGQHTHQQQLLHYGDSISLFPPVGGG